MTFERLAAQYGMQPHPEGGYYKETYRAKGMSGGRNHGTAILYLLGPGGHSKIHRLKSDEIFHFYLGGPMTLVKINPGSGLVLEVALGQDLAAGQQVQHVVEAGWWFGAYCGASVPYALVGCTVAPGFDFADFEMAKAAELIKEYPQARRLIERLMGP